MFNAVFLFTGYPKNCDNAQIYIKEHKNDLVEGVISYTKTYKRKMRVYSW